MRKIKANFFISLDGVVEAPDKWHFPYFDDVRPIGRTRSSSRGAEAAERLAALKAEDGGDITMSGSATLVRWLLREGLLDKLPSSQAFNSGVLNLSYGNCVLVERERLPDDRGRSRELEREIGRRRGSGPSPRRRSARSPRSAVSVRGGEAMRAR